MVLVLGALGAIAGVCVFASKGSPRTLLEENEPDDDLNESARIE